MLVVAVGCGTTRTTDTSRTAVEQLLISDAVDKAVEQLDFRGLEGTRVYLDEQYVEKIVDKDYIVSSVREKLAADGALLSHELEKSDAVVELRVGSLGTDRFDVMIGIPQITFVPVGLLPTGFPPAFPEIPIIKKNKQHGVAKLMVYAYDRETGQFLADSGGRRSETDLASFWMFGLGPFETGSVRDKARLAGDPLPSLIGSTEENGPRHGLAKIPGVDRRKPLLAPRTASNASSANTPSVLEPAGVLPLSPEE